MNIKRLFKKQEKPEPVVEGDFVYEDDPELDEILALDDRAAFTLKTENWLFTGQFYKKEIRRAAEGFFVLTGVLDIKTQESLRFDMDEFIRGNGAVEEPTKSTWADFNPLER